MRNSANIEPISGKRVTVFGLGRFGGGIAVTRWLAGQGARVRVVDQEPAEKLTQSLEQLADLKLEFRLGEQNEADFTDADLLVASPAIAPHHAMMQATRAAGVPITTEICLFIERCPARIFAVTGTKGKSTTTAMLGRMLAARFNTHVGGNIGGSLLEKLANINCEDWVVLELSSYMLEHLGAMRWSPHVAVVTMIASDHLEWHESREAYVEAKKNIVRFQTGGDYAVLNEQDEESMAWAASAVGRVVKYGPGSAAPFALRIPGEHNQLNAQAACAAAQIAGVNWQEAQQAIADFSGLPHRLQLVHEDRGVKWYNDSIATVPQAALAALDCFPREKVIQIIGGKDKHLATEALAAALREKAKAVLCIGATGRMLSDLIGSPKGKLCGDLPTAAAAARQLAQPGDVVLLSPGYPSYDQFVNFEERGELFAKLAQLPK